MQFSPAIKIIDLSLYLENHNILILSDLHLGFEEAALRSQGLLLPRFQLKDELQQLKDIFRKLKNKKLAAVVINGDLKHEFGRISEQEWREILRLFDFLLERAEKIVLVRGNHDIILSPIAKKRNLEVVDYFIIDGIYIMHGHKIPKNREFAAAKTIIIGNEHPAVSIRDKVRSELYKCFLRGRWKGKKVLVLPSFNPLTIGTNVLGDDFLSPILKTGIGSYDVFVVSDKVYDFGTVRKLSRL